MAIACADARRLFPPLLTVVALGGGCARHDSEPMVLATITARPSPSASANNAFALDLYAALDHGEHNLFFSPYSVWTALAMTSAGARGDTAAQTRKVLHLGPDADSIHSASRSLAADLAERASRDGLVLAAANALWFQEGYVLQREFTEFVEESYGAVLQAVDFAGDAEAARRAINAWTERATRGRIAGLVPPGALDELSRLVLTSAVYLRGEWFDQFDKMHTSDEPFTLLDGNKVAVAMMRHTTRFGYAEGRGCQVLEIPYRGGELSMVVILPGSAGGLPQVEESLAGGRLVELLREIREREVEVYVPGFRIECEFDLSRALASMGMTDAFDLGRADFSGMIELEGLFLKTAVHKAFVDVNEKGTEAGAGTAFGPTLCASRRRQRPTVFRADHPFMFLIRDRRSGAILFLGRLTNPGRAEWSTYAAGNLASAEKARSALVELAKADPGAFGGRLDADRLRAARLSGAGPGFHVGLDAGSMWIDVKRRVYSLNAGWGVFYQGTFTVDEAGQWHPTKPARR